MSENGASQKIKDLGNTLMNNKGVRSIKKNLESGKIDINQLKKFAQSDDAKNLKNTAINTLLDVGQSYLNKAKTKMNPPVKKESYHSWRDDFNPTEIESYDIIKAKPLGEGNRTRYRGYGLSGSGNKKDWSKGPNEPAPVDYRFLVKNDKKKEEGDKELKGKVINSSYELGEGKKSCGKGEYFCRDEQKCKPIPKGTYVTKDGTLKKSKT